MTCCLMKYNHVRTYLKITHMNVRESLPIFINFLLVTVLQYFQNNIQITFILLLPKEFDQLQPLY